jgi:hypothetical protein
MKMDRLEAGFVVVAFTSFLVLMASLGIMAVM